MLAKRPLSCSSSSKRPDAAADAGSAAASHHAPALHRAGLHLAAKGRCCCGLLLAPSTLRSASSTRVAALKPSPGRPSAPPDHPTTTTTTLPQRLGSCITAVALAAGLLTASWQLPAAAVTTDQLLFLEAWRAVDRAYVDKGFNGQSWFRVREQYLKSEPMDTRQHTHEAISKLLASLDDPFTRFLSPERLAALRRGTSGAVTGVGMEVSYASDSSAKDASLVVVTPLPGGPADLAGVRPGDAIVAIDGKPTLGLSLYDATDLLLGEADTQVSLAVRHPGQASTQTVLLTRQRLALNPVTTSLCTNVSPTVGPPEPGSSSTSSSTSSSEPLGYIRVSTFNSNTVQAFKDGLGTLKEQGAKRLVLDIRNNGGGLFPSGVQLARFLIPAGDIVLIADANGVRDIYSSDGLTLDSTTPLSVLVNKGTASASEVLAGALQDSKRATLVGESRTFGKGLIQTVVDLSDGSGVAVTVARYQTPAGTDINKIGISPDLDLPVGSLPVGGSPAAASAVCSALQGPEAPRLFR